MNGLIFKITVFLFKLSGPLFKTTRLIFKRIKFNLNSLMQLLAVFVPSVVAAELPVLQSFFREGEVAETVLQWGDPCGPLLYHHHCRPQGAPQHGQLISGEKKKLGGIMYNGEY